VLPVQEVLADEFGSKADVLFFEIKEHLIIAELWNLQSVPAVIIFNRKGEKIFSLETAAANMEPHIRRVLKTLGVE